MEKAIITVNDYNFGSINNQRTHIGNSFVEVEAKRSYFVSTVVGSSVTIKDGAGNTVVVTGSQTFIPALRVEGGLQMSAAASFTAVFFHVSNLPA